jgi:uncharacterized protein
MGDEGRQLERAAADNPDRLEVVWDEAKHARNQREHGVSFWEAATTFRDPLSVVIEDLEHSFDEQRFLIMGESSVGHLLVVSYAEQSDTIRIISARRATPRERSNYEEGR